MTLVSSEKCTRIVRRCGRCGRFLLAPVHQNYCNGAITTYITVLLIYIALGILWLSAMFLEHFLLSDLRQLLWLPRLSAICTCTYCAAANRMCHDMHWQGGSLTAHLPPILWWSRMSSASPADTRDSPANTATRQRTYPKPKPLDEHEFCLASNSNPDAPTSIPVVSPTRSILDEIAVQLNLQENREELVKSWNRFTRKEIGVMASLRALIRSSCAIYSLLLIVE